MNDQNILFGYTPIKNLEKSKSVNKFILMNVQNITFDRPLST